ncbi:hypothetical protein C2869_12320 [Saccharobesus litoralis]|uniref:Cadherin domain-containing protein n=1 Tax=Saccharobesus litoralis TaxID=2172099 RepID=A0A2S0VSL4_9ALTE|nr:putative Ig domain-containing protein [Saccharobesus litoralis]AWB67172.1 hypothetical protein C2869_12320 [Saccharobesus litoralis]
MKKYVFNSVVSAMLPLGLAQGHIHTESYLNGIDNNRLPDNGEDVVETVDLSTSISLMTDNHIADKYPSDISFSPTITHHADNVISNADISSEASLANTATDYQLVDRTLELKQAQIVTELVVIDEAVPDKHLFYKQLKPNVDVIEISSNESGLRQLVAKLQGYQNIKALHLVSHAESGLIKLGSDNITEELLKNELATLSRLDKVMLDGADVLIYGCNLASNSDGIELINLISQRMNVDVAASSNFTGNKDRGGDWDLEITKGDIEAKPLFDSVAMADFDDVLAYNGTLALGNMPTGYGATKSYTIPTTSYTISISTDTSGSKDLYNYAAGYVYVGTADSSNTKSYIQFTNGETFNLTSLYVYLGFGAPSQTINFSSNKNGSVSSTSLSAQGGTTVNFSGSNWEGISTLTIESSTGTLHWTKLDNIVLASLSASNSAPTLSTNTGVTLSEGTSLTIDSAKLDASDDSDSGTGITYTLTTAPTNGALWIDANTDGKIATSNELRTTAVLTSTWTEDDITNNRLKYWHYGTDTTSDSFVVNISDSQSEVLSNQTVSISVTAVSDSTVNLAQGDVVPTKLDKDNNLFEFVNLVDLPANTVLKFTDKGWATSNKFVTNYVSEGFVTWTVPSNISAGQLFRLTLSGLGSVSLTHVSNSNTDLSSQISYTPYNGTAAAMMSIAGEQMFIFQGSEDNPFFIFGINSSNEASALSGDGWTTNSVSDTIITTSTKPGGTGSQNSLAADGEVAFTSSTPSTSSGEKDIRAYTGPTTATDKATWLTRINDVENNWGGDDSSLASSITDSITISSGPTVSTSNLSLSGASGTGGAFKIGDTVTATWDNTGSGDNNSNITAVAVDFSDFGGGSSVAASNSSETWTATYTLVSGSVDSTTANVVVTASDSNGDGSVTSTINATADNVAPTVTDGKISIAGASGTGGAFKTGDTLTVTWDDTSGSGDNNTDTISSVTGDLSAFGGGAAVSFTNSADTWTATLAISAGSIDSTNLNPSITVTDNAGNTTTTSDSTNATLDNIAPTLTDDNISVSDTTLKNGDVVTVTWNNASGGDANSDSISSVVANISALGGSASLALSESGDVWAGDYTVSSGSTEGSNLNVTLTATDNAGNTTTQADSSNIKLDRTAPSISGLTVSSDDTVDNSDTITAVAYSGSTSGVEDGQVVTVVVGGVTVSPTVSSDSFSGTINLSGVSNDNSVAVTADVTDQVGNAATQLSKTIVKNTNAAPTASSVTFTGMLKEGETLTGSYTYNDTDSDAETTSTFKWYRSDDSSGTNKAAISGATSSTYILVSADVGKYISFEVTPVNAVSSGSATESSINSTAVATAVTLAQSDLMITKLNTTTGNKSFDFVNLVEIPSGTVIKFTDKGWQTADAFTTNASGDGVITWTTTSTIAAGHLFRMTFSGSSAVSFIQVSNSNTDISSQVSVSGLSLAATGTMLSGREQIFIYQGADSDPFFIFGIHTQGVSDIVTATGDEQGWSSASVAATSTFASTRPDGTNSQNGLTNGSSAVTFISDPSEVRAYTGTVEGAVKADWITRIANRDNWSSNASAVSESVTASISFDPDTAPTLTGMPTSFNADEDTLTTLTLSNVAVTDSENDTITLVLAADSGTLSATTDTVVVAGSGSSTISFTGSTSEIATYFDTTSRLTFQTASNAESDVTLVATPYGKAAGTATSATITVSGQNDAPTVSSVPTTLTINEDTTANIDLSDATIADVDSGDTVTLLLSASAGTLLTPASDSNIAASLSSNTVTLSGTPANLNTYLDTASNLKYTPVSNVNGAAQATLTLSGNDSSSASLLSTTSITIDITAQNDAPGLAVNNGVTLNEGATVTLSASHLSATDIDDSEVVYTLSSVPSNGTLYLNSSALANSGTFTQANINAGSVSYVHSGSETTSDSFVFVNEDGNEDASTPSSESFSITISAVNDAPVVATNSGATVSEADTVTIAASALSATDNDDAEVTYTVTSIPSNGTLFVSGSSVSANGTFTQSNIGSGVITYVHDGSETTSDSFVFVNEDGNEDSSTPANQTFSLTITPVNDAPAVSVNDGLTLNEGATATISATDLSVTDVDDSEVTYTLSSVPTNGTLFLSSSALANAGTFTQANIAANALTYVHDGSETTADTFVFTNEDGNEDSSTPVAQTFSITVTAQNDAPVIDLAGAGGGAATDRTLTFTEGDDTITLVSSANVTDNDTGEQITGITVALTNDQDGTAEGLNVTGAAQNALTGITGQSDITGQDTITINGATASTSEVATFLRSISYQNSSTSPNTTQRVINVTVNDGDTTATSTISLSVAGLTAATATSAVFNTSNGTGLSPAITFGSENETLTVSNATHFAGSSLLGGGGTDTVVVTATGDVNIGGATTISLDSASLIINSGADTTVTLTNTDGLDDFSQYVGQASHQDVLKYSSISGADFTNITFSNWDAIQNDLATASSGQTVTTTLSASNLSSVASILGDASTDVISIDAADLDLTNNTFSSIDVFKNTSSSETTLTVNSSNLSGITEFDLSDASTATLQSSSALNVSSTTLTGVDVLKTSSTAGISLVVTPAQFNSLSSVIGGSGTDTLVISGAGTLTATPTLSSIEVLRFSDSTSGAQTLTLSAVTANGLSLEATTSDVFSITAATGSQTINAHSNGGSIDVGAGNDTVTLSSGTETVTLGDGSDILVGTSTNLNGATIADLEVGDQIILKGSVISNSNVSFSSANTFLIDTDATDFTSSEVSLALANSAGSTLTASVSNDGTDSTISIALANQAPTITSAPTTLTVTEDIASNIDFTTVTFADGDASDTLTLSLSTSSKGTLSASNTVSGIAVTNSPSANVTLVGTPSNLNTYFDTASHVTYTSSLNDNAGTNLIVTPHDGTEAGTAQTISLAVQAVNDTPTITSTPSTSVNEDAAYNYTISATDVESSTLVYGQASIPSWLTFNSSTQVLSGTPSNSEVGNHTVSLQVSDGTTTIGEQFTITVANTNDAPVIGSSAVTSATEDSVYNYTLSASDDDSNDTLTYSTSGTVPTWLSFNGSSKVLSGTPSNDDVGNHTVSLVVSDGTTTTGQHFTITVANTNDAPEINSTAITSATEDSAYSYTLSASDVDSGDSLTYSAVTKPDWLSINASSGVLSGTPDNDDVGTHSVTLSVTDGTTTDTQSFTITVANTNDAPEINSTAITSATEDSAYSYTLSASDVDSGDSLTYSAVTKPDWLSINASSGVLSGTPDNDDVGTHGVTLSVSDGTTTDTQSFTITVANTNDAPEINSTAITSATEDSAYAYTLSASDVDSGDTLTYAVASKPTWLSFDAGTGVLSGTPENEHVGNHTVSLQVTDGTTTIGEQFTIAVANTNDAPVIGSTANSSATEDSAYSYTLSASDVDTGDSLTYSAVTKPDWLSINASSGVLSGTPDNDDVGTHGVTLSVTDGTTTDTQSFTITVANTNDAPEINSTAITSATEDSAYSYTLSASDVDSGDSLTYSAVTKPDWLSINASSGVLSGTPDNDDVGTHGVTLSVSDGTTTDTQSFSITVANTNDAPVIGSMAITSATEDSAYAYTLSASDVDSGDTLTYAVASKPTWLSFDAGTGVLSGTPENEHVGNHTVSLQVTDGTTTIGEQFTIAVANTNDAPVIGSTAITSATEDSPYAYTLSASDVDVGDTLTYAVASKPTWLSFDAGTGVLSGTPENEHVGNHTVSLQVTDGSTTIGEQFTIAVANTNDAPVIGSTAITSATEDSAYAYTLSASDVDTGDSLTLSAPTKPDWLSFDSANGALTGTPDNDDVGTHAVVLRATDGTTNTEQSFTITVSNTNDAPVIQSTSITSATEDSGYSYTLSATDVDSGDTLTLSAPTTPDWLTFDANSGVLSGTPANANVGTHAVVLRAADGTTNTDQSFTITVSNVNDAPVNATVAHVSISEDTTHTYDSNAVSVNDVDGENLTVQLATSGGTLALSQTTDLTGTTEAGATLSFSGTQANINAALNNLTFYAGDDANGTYTITQTVNDALTSDVDTFEVTVNNVNDAPVNTVPSQVTVSEDTNYTFTGSEVFSVSDADSSDTLTVTLVSSSGQLSLSGTTSLSFTEGDGSADSSMTFSGSQSDINTALTNLVYSPVTNDDSSATITMSVTDGTTEVDSDTVTADISAANDAPVITVATAATNEDVAATLSVSNISVTDIDSASLTVSLTSSNGAMNLADSSSVTLTTGDGTTDTSVVMHGSIASINSALAGMTFIPSGNFNGTGLVTVVAVDESLTQTDTVTINVAAVNDAPVIDSTANPSATEDSAYAYTLSASDVDTDDSLTYSAVTKPDWLSINASSGVLSGTPDNDDVGTHGVTLSVTDGTTTDTQSFTITVANTNDAPIIGSTAITSATEDSAYAYTLSASDVDSGDSLTYSAVTKPDWLSINASSGVLSGTPDNDDVGTHGVTLSVSDGTTTDTQSFSITVANTNDAPVIGSTAITSATEDSAYAYTLSASDVDSGDTLTYAVASKPTWLSFDAGTGVLSGTPENEHVGNHTVSLQVTDGTTTIGEQFTIAVANTNDAPVIGSSAITSATEDSPYAYTLSASDVDVGDTLTYAVASKPTWLNFDAGTGVLSGTPENEHVGNHTVSLQVTDGSTTIGEQFTIAVANTNDAPVIGSTANTSATEDSAYAYTLSASDVDSGDSLTLSAPTKPDWLSFDSASGALTGTPDNDDVGTHAVVLRATDGTTNTEQSFTITVSNTNDAPVIQSTSITSATEDSGYSYTLSATDVDSGDTLTLSAPTKPDWLTFDANSGVLSGTPANANVGTHAVVLRAADGTTNTDQSFTITVSNVNDAPVNATVAHVSISEDTTHTYDSNAVSVNDVDGENLTVQLATSGGTLALSQTTDLTGTTEAGATLSFSGTQANINAALNNLTFYAGDDANGTYTITQTVNDALTSDVDTFEVTVNNVNDAPVNSVPSQVTVSEDTNYTFTGSEAFSVSDADSSDTLTVTLVSSSGQLSLSGTTSLSFTEGDGSADSSMTFSGSQSDINTALTNLVYSPVTNDDSSATITMSVTDGTTEVDSDTVTADISATNDAPVITVATAATNEDTAVSLTSAQLSITDIDSSSLTVSLNASNGLLALASTTDVNISLGNGSTDQTLVFNGAIADVQAALNGAVFTPNANFNGDANIVVQVSDGELTDTETLTVSVAAVNDAPTDIALSSSSIKHSDGANATIGTLSTTDIDAFDTHTYSMCNTVGFSISGDKLVIADPTSFAQGTTEVCVQTTDQLGGNIQETLTISVTDDVAPDPVSAESAIQFSWNTLNINTDTFLVDYQVTVSEAAIGTTYNHTITSSGTAQVSAAAEAGSVSQITGSGTITSTSQTISGIDVSGLADGTLTLAVTLTDAAGNVSATSTATLQKDTVAPTVTLSSNQSQPVGGAFDITLQFSEDVSGLSLADIQVTNGSASNLQGSGSTYTATITPNSNATVNIDVAAGAVQDSLGNDSIAATQLTVVVDGTAPTISSLSPLDNATGVALDTHLIMTFDEDVQALTSGNNTITVTRTDTNEVFASITADSSLVSVNGAQVTIDLGSATLRAGTAYHVEIGDNAFSDRFNNGFAGISGSSTFNFTTANQAPVSADDTASLDEDGSVAIAVLANDSDTDSELNPASVMVKQAPANGSTSINTATGVITYTPSANFNGVDVFTYQVNDVQGDSSTEATVSITVNAVNDVPVAVNDVVATAEDTATTLTLTSNDTDIEDGVPTGDVVIVTQGSHGGTAKVLENGSVEFTPASNFNGTDAFTYQVKDSEGASSNIATVSVAVSSVNDQPIATDDQATTNEDTSVTIDVLANDSDTEDTSFNMSQINIVSQGSLGTATLGENSIVYTPNANANGVDTFTYAVKDSEDLTSGTATVTVSITAVNDAPVAVADTAVLLEDASLEINVLGNDTDVDTGDSFDTQSVKVVTAPESGTTSINATTGLVTYTPNANFNGADSFVYTVADASGAVSNQQTVSITVSAVNDIPVANPDQVNTLEDTEVTISPLTNDTDVDGSLDETSVAITTVATKGTTVINSDGTIIYTPNANENGLDTFGYTVMDNEGGVSEEALITVSIEAVNDAPTINANLSNQNTDEDAVYTYTLDTSVFTEIDSGDTLTYSITGLPTWLSFDANTLILSGTPTNDDVGEVSLTVTATDSELAKVSQVFVLTVNNVNDSPELVGDILDTATNEDAAFNLVLDTSVFNDIDTGDALTYTVSGLPGWMSFNAETLTLSGTPTNDDVAVVNLTVTATDSQGQFISDSFALNVTNTNDAPVVNNDVYSVNEGDLLSLGASQGVLSNDFDVDAGDVLQVSLVSNPKFANSFTLNSDGSFSYTHNSTENFKDSFSYRVTDGMVTSDVVTVTLNIAPVNDAPEFLTTPQLTTVAQGETFSYQVITNDPDDSQTLVISQAPSWLSLSENNVLSGTVPFDQEVGVQNIVLTTADDEFEVKQSFDLSISERDVALLSITGVWSKKVVTAGETVQLTLTAKHVSGPAVAGATLVNVFAGNATFSSTNTLCSFTSNTRAECLADIAVGGSVNYVFDVVTNAAGDIASVAQVNDTAADGSRLARKVFDISVSEVIAEQPNDLFNLSNATAIAAADVNLDTAGVEMVAGTTAGDNVKIIRILETGVVNGEVVDTIDNTGRASKILINDMDQDGFKDVLVVNKTGQASTLYTNLSGSGFEASQGSQTFGLGIGAQVIDYNQDTFKDIVIFSSSQMRFYASNAGTFSDEVLLIQSRLSEIRSVVLGDIDGDGTTDLTVGLPTRLAIVRNFLTTLATSARPAAGQVSAAAELSFEDLITDELPMENVTQLAAADLDGDGKEEIVVTNSFDESNTDDTDNVDGAAINVVSLDSSTNQVKVAASFGAASSHSVQVTDTNNDGSPDLLVGNDNGVYQIYQGTGKVEEFNLANTVIVEATTLVVPVDVNEDGLADVVAYEDTEEEVRLYLSKDDGQIGTRAELAVNLDRVGDSTLYPGSTVEFSTTVSNTGPDVARQSRLIFVGMTVDQIEIDGATCVQVNNDVVCDLNNIASQDSVTLTGRYQVNQTGSRQVSVEVSTIDTETQASNNQASLSVTIDEVPSVTVTAKSGSGSIGFGAFGLFGLVAWRRARSKVQSWFKK